jgi:hypothetical protein
MKLQIEKLYINDKDFNGNPIINKFTNQPEKKYTIVAGGQKFKVYGTQKQLQELTEGGWVEGEVEDKEYQGHPYKVVNLPKPLSPELQQIKEDIEKIKHFIGMEEVEEKQEELIKEVEDDIPF